MKTLLALTVAFILTHDGHNDEWLKTLRNQNQHSCCDGSDAFKIEDPDWKVEKGEYFVKLRPGGNWIHIPADRLVTVPNRVGYALVWPLMVDGEDVVRCFMPGSGA